MMDDSQAAFATQYPQYGFDLDMMKVRFCALSTRLIVPYTSKYASCATKDPSQHILRVENATQKPPRSVRHLGCTAERLGCCAPTSGPSLSHFTPAAVASRDLWRLLRTSAGDVGCLGRVWAESGGSDALGRVWGLPAALTRTSDDLCSFRCVTFITTKYGSRF